MSVRSRIAMKQKDNTYKSISCHHDGNLFGNGKMLYENYQDPIKVELLMSLGDLSSLKEYIFPNILKQHDFDNPLCDVCVAYHRDRGEKLNFEVDKELESLIKNVSLSDQEYLYLYEDEHWKYADTTSKDYNNIVLNDLENDLIKYNIIDQPSFGNNSYIDELSNELVQYVKNADPYEYNDDYENDDHAFNDMKKSLSTTSGVDTLIESLCSDINYYVSENDLSNDNILDNFKSATDLLIKLNRYAKILEKQNDKEMDM